MKVRKPFVAGYFYQASRDALIREIEESFAHRLGPGATPKPNLGGERRIVALICPHAGYMYSGPTAARAYSALAQDGVPEAFVILGPNHTGLGSLVSVWPGGFWETPLGLAQVELDLARKVQAHSKIIDMEELAHVREHSIEVQLPFLQYLYGESIKFVPICMLMQDLKTSVEIGEAIAMALAGRNAVIIASSDMTHYEPHDEAMRKDRLAIEAIQKLDEGLLQKVVEEYNVTMCGYGPVTAAIRAAKILGATKAVILGHSTSGDVTGDKAAVVGYLAASLTR